MNGKKDNVGADRLHGGAGAGHVDGRKATESGNLSGQPWWRTHPGALQSLIPVWGSGREAIADANTGHPRWAAANAALAIADAVPVDAVAENIAKGLARGGYKFAKSYAWKPIRRTMGKQGYFAKGQVAHHWLLERNRGIGQHFPDWIKNQPWNLKAMPSAEVHNRISNASHGLPRFNVFERYWHGTPGWAKAGKGSVGGHAALFEHEKARQGR